jgi:hypothetical protein
MIRTYLSIHGRYGWVCTACNGESRYTYATRERAEQLGSKHKYVCRKRAI